jgi:hypothetical protein
MQLLFVLRMSDILKELQQQNNNLRRETYPVSETVFSSYVEFHTMDQVYNVSNSNFYSISRVREPQLEKSHCWLLIHCLLINQIVHSCLGVYSSECSIYSDAWGLLTADVLAV